MKFANTYTSTDDLPGIDFTVIDPDTGEVVPEESRTVQSQGADADINNIVKRFKLTGELPQVKPKIPLSDDFREAGQFDLGSALRYVNDAQRAFMQYPAEIRAKFDNDPALFCDFVENPANFDECVKLGILAKPEAPAVTPEPVVSESK